MKLGVTIILVASGMSVGVARAQEAAVPQPAAPTAAPIAAPAAAPVQSLLTLVSGETLRGVVVSQGEQVVFEHAVLGKMTLAKDKVKSIAPEATAAPAPAEAQAPAAAPPAPAPAPEPAPAPAAKIAVEAPKPEAPATPVVPPAAPAEPSFFEKWAFSVEGGFNGADGNSNRSSYRVNLSGRRDTPEMQTSLGLGWWYTRADDKETQNRTTYDVRNEWPLKSGSSWRWYVASTGEFDAFQLFDYRLTASTGLSWNFWKDDALSLTLRTGAGGTREFGPDAADPSADLFPGIDLAYKVDERSSITGSYDGVWNMADIERYRSVLRLSYDITIDPKNGLGLKLGVENRYETTPTLGRDRNDLEYFALITFKF